VTEMSLTDRLHEDKECFEAACKKILGQSDPLPKKVCFLDTTSKKKPDDELRDLLRKQFDRRRTTSAVQATGTEASIPHNVLPVSFQPEEGKLWDFNATSNFAAELCQRDTQECLPIVSPIWPQPIFQYPGDVVTQRTLGDSFANHQSQALPPGSFHQAGNPLELLYLSTYDTPASHGDGFWGTAEQEKALKIAHDAIPGMKIEGIRSCHQHDSHANPPAALKMESNKPSRGGRYTCKILIEDKACGESFAHRSSLDRHSKKHQGLRNLSCELCAMAFATKDILVSHYWAHVDLPMKKTRPGKVQKYSLECVLTCITTRNMKERLEKLWRKQVGTDPREGLAWAQ
jgi:hypothetical protein